MTDQAKTKATIADRIIARMGRDGAAWEMPSGVDFVEFLDRVSLSRVRTEDMEFLGSSTVFMFDDASRIEVFSEGWDTPEGWVANGGRSGVYPPKAHGGLYRLSTGEFLRAATEAEAGESLGTPGDGAIIATVDGRACAAFVEVLS